MSINSVDRFAGTRLEDLKGMIPTLCKDRDGSHYLQRKLDEGGPRHRDMILQEALVRFADLMTGTSPRLSIHSSCLLVEMPIKKDQFGSYLCQKLLEYSTDEQFNIICQSLTQNLVKICIDRRGSQAVQRLIDFLSIRRRVSVVPGYIFTFLCLQKTSVDRSQMYCSDPFSYFRDRPSRIASHEGPDW
jgi:hypothetical protein